MKEKAHLVILGDLFAKSEHSGWGGQSSLLVCFADLSKYDTSQALFIEGDVTLDNIVPSDKLILVTGDYSVSENLNV